MATEHETIHTQLQFWIAIRIYPPNGWSLETTGFNIGISKGFGRVRLLPSH